MILKVLTASNVPGAPTVWTFIDRIKSVTLEMMSREQATRRDIDHYYIYEHTPENCPPSDVKVLWLHKTDDSFESVAVEGAHAYLMSDDGKTIDHL